MDVMPKKILVTGAAGGVGYTICQVLKDHNFFVRGLIRPEDNSNKLGGVIGKENIVLGYVEDADVIDEAIRGMDAVINCAALLPNALHLGEEAFTRVNVSGSVNILRQAARHKVRNAIFFSTISVVDHLTRKITQEEIREYVENPHDAYLLSKIKLEKELEKESKTFDGQISIIRPAFIYGPGNFSVWQEGLNLVIQGKMVLIGDGNVALPLIYAQDIARFVLLLLNRLNKSRGIGIYVLASPEPTTMRQVFHFIADYLGVKHPRNVPYWPLYIAASIVEFLPEKLKFGRLKILTKARMSQYSKGYDLSKVINPPPLGFVADTKYQEGLANMLDDYKKTVMSIGKP